MRLFVLASLALAPILAVAQDDPPKKRHSQKEVRAQVKEDERKSAAEIRGKLEDHLKVAANREENPERRRSAAEILGHSQDLRAAKVLLDIVDDPDPAAAKGALSGLRTMTKELDDNPEKLNEVKRIVQAKVRAIAKEEPKELDQAIIVVDLLNNIGNEDEAVKLAQKVVAKGNRLILHNFCYWDESAEPPVFRIKASARPLFADAMAKSQAEQTRAEAAEIFSRAGYKDEAFLVLSDVMLHGKNLNAKMSAMKDLREMGDERSKSAVREAVNDAELARSAKYVLMSWDQRPKK